MEVGRASFESIYGLETDCVNLAIVVSKIGWIERLKIVFFNSLLRLCESLLVKVWVTVSVLRGLRAVICDSRYIIDWANISGY